MPVMLIIVIGALVLRFRDGNLPILLGTGAVVVVGVLSYAAYSSGRDRRRAAAETDAAVAALTGTVESMLGDTANAILDVEDRPALSTDAVATEHFQRAVAIFLSVDDGFATAKTVEQLRLLISDLDEALWRLGAALAVLDGEAPPERERSPSRTPATRITTGESTGDAVARWLDGGSGRRHRRRGRSC
jgi:hypothetical protein